MNIARSIDPQLVDKTTLSCQSFILVGDMSPFLDDAVEVNSRLNPKKTTFLKVRNLNLKSITVVLCLLLLLFIDFVFGGKKFKRIYFYVT